MRFNTQWGLNKTGSQYSSGFEEALTLNTYLDLSLERVPKLSIKYHCWIFAYLIQK